MPHNVDARVVFHNRVPRPAAQHRVPSHRPPSCVAQLKLADQGRKDFTKRIKKQPPAERPEKLAPLVSDRVYDAVEHGTSEI